jgi:hypothetical protein
MPPFLTPRRTACLLPLLLTACATSRQETALPLPSGGWSCVPYVRARTGLPLRGDAWQWWQAAEGRYDRSSRPAPGGVLVFRRTGRLPQGHVALVTRVVSAREIRVDHANWASGADKGKEARDQPVRDISPGNDWSLVQVWYPPVRDWGRSSWPTFGFVGPDRA